MTPASVVVLITVAEWPGGVSSSRPLPALGQNTKSLHRGHPITTPRRSVQGSGLAGMGPVGREQPNPGHTPYSPAQVSWLMTFECPPTGNGSRETSDLYVVSAFRNFKLEMAPNRCHEEGLSALGAYWSARSCLIEQDSQEVCWR